jgi:hypothetical protein
VAQPITDAHFNADRKMRMVKDDYLIRAISCAREKTRAANPKDLSFEIDDNGIPEGLNVWDVHTGHGDRKQRHIICYTDKQVRLLATSRWWYMDGTFKIVKNPFIQLWTINAFINVKNLTSLCQSVHEKNTRAF